MSACGGDTDGGPSGPVYEIFEPIGLTIDDVMGLYALDGDAKDLSAASRHGTVYGATPAADRFGREGFALSFDGADDYIAFEDRLIGTNTQWFTVSMWFRTDTDAEVTLFHEGEANGEGIWVRIVPKTNRILAHSRDAFTLKTDNAFNDGAWHHLALRASSTSVALWIDGQMNVESDWSEDFVLDETANPMVLGREGEPEGDLQFNYFDGDLDDMVAYSRPLSGKEIQALFKDGPNQLPSAEADATPLGFDVTLNGGESRDADGEIVQYSWDFGDGSVEEGSASVEHTYNEPGLYQVTLIVTDDEGATSQTTIVVTISDPDDHSDAGPWPTDWALFEEEVLIIVNQRRKEGAICGGESYPAVGPVEMDSKCRISSRLHSVDMATQEYFSHTGLSGTTPFDRMAAAGFDGAYPWGENIAAGQTTPAGVMQAWMDSPGHCRNIMNDGYGVLGVGYHLDPASPMNHYWTQNFGGSH